MSASTLRFAEHVDASAGDAARRTQPASPWRDIVGRLARSCRARSAALVIHDLNGQRGYIHTAVNIDLNFARAYAERYAAQNVWLDVPERFQVVGSAFRGSELVSDEELTATRFYGEWLRPQDLLGHMFGVIASENDSVAFLMFGRRSGDEPFEDSAVAMVQAVLPAAAATLRLERQMGMLRSRLMLTWSILDELAIGVLIVDGGGRILGINATGRDIMGARNGVAARNGYLSCERQRDAAKLRSVLDAVAMGGGGGGHESSKAVEHQSRRGVAGAATGGLGVAESGRDRHRCTQSPGGVHLGARTAGEAAQRVAQRPLRPLAGRRGDRGDAVQRHDSRGSGGPPACQHPYHPRPPETHFSEDRSDPPVSAGEAAVVRTGDSPDWQQNQRRRSSRSGIAVFAALRSPFSHIAGPVRFTLPAAIRRGRLRLACMSNGSYRSWSGDQKLGKKTPHCPT